MASKSQKNGPQSTQRNVMIKGRFKDAQSDSLTDINESISFDHVLYAEDIAGSLAHAKMLAAKNIISADDLKAIEDGLATIKSEIESGDFPFSVSLEDIHMNIEARLHDKIGPAAGRLHTARSRNDQVATDFKLWCRAAIDDISTFISALQAALIARAEQHTETIMPGFTHLQVAQPVSLGFHLMAYFEMLDRDNSRLADCRARLNQSPLGAAALAGTVYDIDRDMTAQDLGFDAPTANAMDSVSDRDFALELLSDLAILGTHMSRLAEEFIIWASPNYGFISLPDALSTGSSIMPQKRNPDGAELVRGKTGRLIAALTGLLSTMKGLPLAYSKDMQEDKEPVFDAVKTSRLCLKIMAAMVEGIEFNKDAMMVAAEKGYPTATDAADWMVKELNLPFREAHEITGKLVQLVEQKQIGLSQLSADDFKAIDERLHEDLLKAVTLKASLSARKSFGGTAPDAVMAHIKTAKEKLA